MLGHVAAVTRRADGGANLVIDFGGVLGAGSRRIAVPAEALALLYPSVAAVGLTPEQLGSLPAPGPEPTLPPDAVITMGVVRPFH